ncbi:MAG: 16S rRNA processing protein RimM [Clostridia bacterium]|nr:16S rRNA processing protein RimM [Clostridia bacterium]
MNAHIIVGKVLKPQGVRGEVKISPYTEDLSRFKKMKYLIIESTGARLNVLSVRVDNAFAYVKLEGIDDRNLAESLRDEMVSIDRQDAVKPKEGHYYLVDLIGCQVILENKVVGIVREILQYGAADVYVLDTEGDELMFPAGDGVITEVDVESRRIYVDKTRFEEVTVVDDED